MHKFKKCAFSVKQFYTFLAEAGSKGVLSSEKQETWQETVHEFEAVMQPSECEDLRSIDIEGVSQRYIELVSRQNVSITPWTIHLHKTQLQNAIGDFIAYVINPLKYCDSKKSAMPHIGGHAGAFSSAQARGQLSAGAL